MADGAVALLGGKLCVLPGNGSAPIPIGGLGVGADGIPQDILDRLRRAFPLHTKVRTSNPPIGGNAANPLWTAEPLRVGAILSLALAPGIVFLTEGTSVTSKGFQAAAGALLTFGLECPDELYGFSATGDFTASLMEILINE